MTKCLIIGKYEDANEYLDREVEIRDSFTIEQCIAFERQWAYLAVAPFQAGLTYKRLMAICESIYTLCDKYKFDGLDFYNFDVRRGLIEKHGLSDNTLINACDVADVSEIVGDLGYSAEDICLQMDVELEYLTQHLSPEKVSKINEDRRYAKCLLEIYRDKLIVYSYYSFQE